MEPTVEGLCRCTCGRIYETTMTSDGLQFREVTKAGAVLRQMAPHACPDNRVRYHEAPT